MKRVFGKVDGVMVKTGAAVALAAVLAGCVQTADELPSGKNPDLVARVMRGELKTAKVSWWGFDAVDSTAVLQAAIDSRVPELVIDRMPAPWTVTPLMGVSDQTLRLEPGVVVQAKEGAFQDGDDVLLTFASCTNVTLVGGEGSALRMRRSDYHDKAKYKWSEWRHAVSLLSAVNVRIENLTIAESGGDGLYLGLDWKRHNNLGPCRNVTVRNCVFDKNYRQGISVISANGLLIEDTVMKDTWGTPPAAGIDFEPNRPEEELVNCVMRNCRSENNQGSGYDLVMFNFKAKTTPVDIRLENCRATGNKDSVVYAGVWDIKDGTVPSYPTGRIEIVGGVFEGAQESAVKVFGKPREAVRLSFRDCRFAGAGCASGRPDIQLVSTTARRWWPTVDGIDFENCTVEQNAVRPWITAFDTKARTNGVEAISGTVTVKDPQGGKTVVLDAAWRAENFGKPTLPASFKRVAFDHRCVKVVDRAPGEKVALTPIKVRGDAKYFFYAPKAGKVRFTGRFVRIGATPIGKEIVVTGKHYNAPDSVAKVPLQTDGKPQEFSVEVPEPGFYTMEIPTGKYHAYQLEASDVPVAIEAGAGGVRGLFMPDGDLWFDVRKNAAFGFFAGGSDEVEATAAELFDPDGRSVWRNAAVTAWDGMAGKGTGGLWRVRLGKPAKGAWEDAKIALEGEVAQFFPSDRKFWTVVEDPAANPVPPKPEKLRKPDLVAKALKGELRKANVSWWGFDREDSTRFLQAALDSGVRHLVIQKGKSPWITTSLRLLRRQGLTIELEPGAELVAKEGAFQAQGDALLHLFSCTNVILRGGAGSVLRMRRSDYHDKTKYLWSEWRHGVELLSCGNVRLEGLTVAESGGDGLYLGIDWRHGNCEPNLDITVRNCVFDRNYRQGISVISVDGLLIEDTVMQDTWGTPPAAGIDFEPNRPVEKLKRIVLRNCRSDRNQGSAYETFSAQFNAKSEPIDVTLDRCTSDGGYFGFCYVTSSRDGTHPRGRYVLNDCTFTHARKMAARIQSAPEGSVDFEFHRCRFVDNNSKADGYAWTPAVQLLHESPTGMPTDGVLLDDCYVKQLYPGDWFSRNVAKKGAPKNVRGKVTVVDHAGKESVHVLDDAWAAGYFAAPKK